MPTKDQVKGRLKQISSMAIRHPTPLVLYKKLRAMYFLSDISKWGTVKKYDFTTLAQTLDSIGNNDNSEFIIYSKELMTLVYLYLHKGAKGVILNLTPEDKDQSSIKGLDNIKTYLKDVFEDSEIKSYTNHYTNEEGKNEL